MSTSQPVTAPVLIPFVCPICAGANGVHLISLSRAGGVECVVCKKWLRSDEVARAMHSPRAARTTESAPIRTHAAARVAPSRRAAITWPPTAESRAAARPLVRRN